MHNVFQMGPILGFLGGFAPRSEIALRPAPYSTFLCSHCFKKWRDNDSKTCSVQLCKRDPAGVDSDDDDKAPARPADPFGRCSTHAANTLPCDCCGAIFSRQTVTHRETLGAHVCGGCTDRVRKRYFSNVADEDLPDELRTTMESFWGF